MRVRKIEENEEKLDKIYLVPHTHYDAICFLTKEDFFYINIDLILKRVVDILDKTDDYKFTMEQTFWDCQDKIINIRNIVYELYT